MYEHACLLDELRVRYQAAAPAAGCSGVRSGVLVRRTRYVARCWWSMGDPKKQIDVLQDHERNCVILAKDGIIYKRRLK